VVADRTSLCPKARSRPRCKPSIHMSQLTSAPADLHATIHSELTLCVRGTAHNGRLVRLQGVKCTIGSDSQCTLRLRAPGVSPLHCLIVRGDERTVVRSLSGVTRINGHDISEAALAVGDRLMIGVIEFEVVGGVGASAPAEGQISENRPVLTASHEPPAQHNVDQLIAQRRVVARQGRGRAKRLLNLLRELRREHELANLRLARLEESSERLGRELAESESQRQRLREEQSRHECAAGSDDESRRQLEEQRNAVEQERGTVEQERGRLEQARGAMEEERRSFDQQRSDFAQERSVFEQERNKFEQQRGALEQDWSTLARAKEQIEQERTAVAQSTQRVEQEQSALAQAKQQFEQEQSALAEAKQQFEQERSALAEAKQQFEQVRDATAQERTAIEQERAALQQERSAAESQHLLLQQELRTFEEHKRALTSERLDWQTEASRAEADLAGRRQELDRRAAAIEKQQSEQEAARRRVEETQKALAKRQETLQQAENDLSERKRQAQEQELALIAVRKALEKNHAKLDMDRQALTAEQTKLCDERESLAELREKGQFCEDEWSGRLAEQARQLSESSERLKVATKDMAGQQELVEAMRQEFDEERQQWENERARLRFEYERQLRSLGRGARRGELQAGQSSDEEPAAPQVSLSFETDSASEIALAEVEATEVARAELDESTGPTTREVVADDADSIADPTSDDEVVASDEGQPQEELSIPPSDLPDEPPAESHSNKPHEADEESIDDYMTRLLKRVQNIGQRPRAASGNASQAHAAQSAAPPQQSGQNTQPPAEEGSAVQEVLAKLSRRAAAPELSSDIAAMRELANLSARAAIDKYAYRNWGRAAFGKFTIAVLAAAAGVGAVHFASAPDSMLMYAGLLSFVIALFWLLQAGILVKNVYQASRRQARMAKALCDSEPESPVPVSKHSHDEDELSPAEIIAVQES
jgi:pSer/pThr/pTyr-binding forkhead associated (FHA) protein/predicted  nucleic acid-binding Zn-ribbon protein